MLHNSVGISFGLQQALVLPSLLVLKKDQPFPLISCWLKFPHGDKIRKGPNLSCYVITVLKLRICFLTGEIQREEFISM